MIEAIKIPPCLARKSKKAHVSRSRFLVYPVVLLTTLGLATGCATVDPVDNRAETINRNIADYGNTAILLNIARASKFEPLNFVSLTGVVGRGTILGSLGIPSITVGPIASAAARNFIFGPNRIDRTLSNDANMSAIDDEKSYRALLSPVTVSTVALLLDQGCPRELILFLLVDRIRVTSSDGRTSVIYQNSLANRSNFEQFGGKLADLLVAGLTESGASTPPGIESGRVPTGKKGLVPALSPYR